MENGDKAFCYICTKAFTEKKLSASCKELTYISNGYTNWKDAINNFTQHEKSKCHAESVLKIVTVPKTMKDVGECLSSQHAKEKSVWHAVCNKNSGLLNKLICSAYKLFSRIIRTLFCENK